VHHLAIEHVKPLQIPPARREAQSLGKRVKPWTATKIAISIKYHPIFVGAAAAGNIGGDELAKNSLEANILRIRNKQGTGCAGCAGALFPWIVLNNHSAIV
jgi:ribulose 1,5-bisphosphate synthetase/thiazole synthase